MRTIKNGADCTVIFDDVADAIAATRLPELPQWESASNGHARGRIPGKESNGGASIEQARELAAHGWPAGWEKVARIADHIGQAATATAPRHEIRYDVSGDFVDVGRYVTGEPECMADYVETTSQAPGERFLQIEIDCGLSCGIEAATIERRGAAIAAMVDLLESVDIRVAVYARLVAKQAKGTASLLVPLKAYSDHLDRDRLGFWLIHPAALRQVFFALLETCGDVAEPNAFYGEPIKAPAKLPETGLTIQTRATAASTMPEFATDASAAAWVREQCKACGVEFEH